MRRPTKCRTAALVAGFILLAAAWQGAFAASGGVPPGTGPQLEGARGWAAHDPASVRSEIERSKSAGSYDAALALARDASASLLGDSTAPAWWRVETASMVTTLERACALPPAGRARLAEADRQGPRIEELIAGGRYGEAAELAREQLAARRALLGELDLDTAESRNDLGRALLALGELAAAQPELEQSLAIRRALLGEEHPLVATSLNNLGAVLGNRGDFMGCRKLWEHALDLRRRLLGPEDLQTVGSLNNMGFICWRLGEYAQAARVLREARGHLVAHLGESDPGVLRTTRNLAMAERERGRLATADSLLVRVVELQRAQGHREELGWSLCALGEVRERRGELASAERFQREAIALERETLGDRHPAVAALSEGLCRTLLRAGRPEAAEPLSREALAIRRATLGPLHADLAESLVLLARCRRARGADREAAALLEEAARIYERSRRTIERDLVRATFLEPPHERLAAAYLRLGRGDDAWRACERGRGRLLADLLANPDGAAADGSSAEPFDLLRVQRALDDRSAVIGWVDVDDLPAGRDSWVYVIRPAGPVHWVRLGEADGDLPGELRSELHRPARLGLAPRATPRLQELAHRLWLERIAPVMGELAGSTRLVVIPSGAMLGVPLEALRDDDGRLLDERWAVAYAPSATVFAQLRERPGREEGRPSALLLGDPEVPPSDENPALWPLPWARAEVDSLAAALPGAQVITGAAMTEAAVGRLAAAHRLAGFDYIHFATHALANNEEPELSALALSRPLGNGVPAPGENGPAGDGWLTAGEIARGWNLHARLVSLSACETGLGRAVAGEGYVGFAHAFLRAGARNLLVSLWSVSDEATARLMERFYRNLVDRPARSESEALRDAKAWLRSRADPAGRRLWEHPYYWAGFVLFGPGD